MLGLQAAPQRQQIAAWPMSPYSALVRRRRAFLTCSASCHPRIH